MTRRDEDTARFYVLRLTEGERAALHPLAESILTGFPVDAGPGSGGALRGGLENLQQAMEQGEEDLLDLATSRLRAWYYGRVRDIAEDVLGAMLAGEVDDLQDYLHETVDSTDLVVYTYKAKCVLLASDNEDAHADEMGEAPSSPEAGAYFALRADVLERLQAMVDYGPPEGVTLPEGFDLDDSSTWTAQPDEADEDEPTDLEGRLEHALGLQPGTLDGDATPKAEGGAV